MEKVRLRNFQLFNFHSIYLNINKSVFTTNTCTDYHLHANLSSTDTSNPLRVGIFSFKQFTIPNNPYNSVCSNLLSQMQVLFDWRISDTC